MSDPESPLSDLSSADDDVEIMQTPNHSSRPSVDTHGSNDVDPFFPPSKRRKVGSSASAILPDRAPSSGYPDDDDTDISEDTEGSAPGSPSHDEHALRADQVTACQWEGCPTGDLGNSDDLIRHVQAEHISPKRVKYTCEWGDCARKGTNHPSGYALKAHMRSHTKEKPFFCALPECDRSFTRSDALAKHMRTVHEPEPSRAAATNANPIDPATGLPKKGPKLRLMNGSKGSSAPAAGKDGVPDFDDANDPSLPNDNIQYIPAHHPVTGQPGFMITYPPDIHFSQFESEIPADQLMRLLRRQIFWAEKESEDLKKEIEMLETQKREEWVKKEVLLEGVMEAELARGRHAEQVQNGLLDDMSKDLDTVQNLKWTQTPWWKNGSMDGVARADGSSRIDAMQEHVASEERDVEEELARRTAQANKMMERAESTAQTNRDDDMNAVAALMGLSAGPAGR